MSNNPRRYEVEMVCPFCPSGKNSLKVTGEEIGKGEYSQETNNKIIKWITHMFYDHGPNEAAQVFGSLPDVYTMMGGSREQYFKDMADRWNQHKNKENKEKEKMR